MSTINDKLLSLLDFSRDATTVVISTAECAKRLGSYDKVLTPAIPIWMIVDGSLGIIEDVDSIVCILSKILKGKKYSELCHAKKMLLTVGSLASNTSLLILGIKTTLLTTMIPMPYLFFTFAASYLFKFIKQCTHLQTLKSKDRQTIDGQTLREANGNVIASGLSFLGFIFLFAGSVAVNAMASAILLNTAFAMLATISTLKITYSLFKGVNHLFATTIKSPEIIQNIQEQTSKSQMPAGRKA